MVEVRVFYIIGVALATIIVAQLINWVMSRSFQQWENQQKRLAMLRLEPYEESKTKYVVVRRIIVFMVYFVGLAMMVMSLPGAKTIAVSMLAGAGVAALIIGFAVQQSFANIFSGIMIAFTQPFRIGDRIEFRGQFATVEDIGLSHTRLRAWNNKHIIVPNSKLTEEVIDNFTIGDPKMGRPLEIGVAYDTDIKKAKKIMVEELKKHPEFIDNRSDEAIANKEPVANVLMKELGDSAITLRMVFWTKDQATAWSTEHELREAIKERFDKAGIQIPFPQRTVWMNKAPKRSKPRKSTKKSRTSGKKKGKSKK